MKRIHPDNPKKSLLPFIFSSIMCLLLVQLTWSDLAQGQKNNALKGWPAATITALEKAGDNRPELEKALNEVPVGARPGMRFLIDHMPERDLKSIKGDYLIENLTLAYKAFREAPWADKIPEEIFLNNILPYINATEPRENWRQQLHDIALPLIKGCTTPSEACKALNEKIFPILKVKYSTKRRAADQGPLETMGSGMATCTGLSILLVDACRSVGIPARIVGTPLWSNNSGNHTWVEVWDKEWLFTGAAEQDSKGFNRGWFVENASKAVKEERKYAIYAASYKKTGLTFPMNWAREVDYVNAENVTDRYTGKVKGEKLTGQRLQVDVYNRPLGERVAAQVNITNVLTSTLIASGISKGDTADMNDHLYVQLKAGETLFITARFGSKMVQQYYTPGDNVEDKLPMYLEGVAAVIAPPMPTYVPQVITHPLSVKELTLLNEALDPFFKASAEAQAKWKFSKKVEKLLASNEPAVRQAVWQNYHKAAIHDSLKSDYDHHTVHFEQHISPYTVKYVGKRPANGWALFIAMHGGGNVPQEFNDSQWRHMQIYYRDHPEAGGYIYVALRAPDNTWNGFYTDYTYPLIQNLLRQFMLFGDVDPNKKFIMGYSHGGYGAFAIGPKMPDYFAAVHASASAPADGALAETLRNTVFTTMVGGKDTAYGRYARIKEFEQTVRKLRGSRTDIFPVTVQIVKDHPHSGLPDREKIAEMYPNFRNPVPHELSWPLTDSVIHNFFWLKATNPMAGKRMDATWNGNRLEVSTDLKNFSILADSRLVDYAQPIIARINGKEFTKKLKPDLLTLCRTMVERGDPELAFAIELKIGE